MKSRMKSIQCTYPQQLRNILQENLNLAFSVIYNDGGGRSEGIPEVI